MTTVDTDRPVKPPQAGERELPLSDAYPRGLAAAAELGLDTRVKALREGSPGTWSCVLERGGSPVHQGFGLGKGDREAARVGAVFEALEHHLSSVVGLAGPAADTFVARAAHDVASDAALRGDGAVALLADLPDGPLACAPYQPLGRPDAAAEVAVPVFLSMPDFIESDHEAARHAAGDTYDYTAIGRYSSNNGWAAGTDVVEATVHAVNEAVERDAFSLLLVEQFLTRGRAPRLRVVDPASLPPDLRDLRDTAETAVGRPVHLIDMTSDLGIPTYLVFVEPAPGEPARVRGCGASLSPLYAAHRALSEVIQVDLSLALARTNPSYARLLPPRRDWTGPYPALHACYLGDLGPALSGAIRVPFGDRPAPPTPREHLDALLAALTGHGLNVMRWTPYATENLAVVNVLVPGLERFLLVTDGQLVLPGPRGREARERALARL
ncbi:YcaO-like family protein [Streptomyces sp. LZ34]